ALWDRRRHRSQTAAARQSLKHQDCSAPHHYPRHPSRDREWLLLTTGFPHHLSKTSVGPATRRSGQCASCLRQKGWSFAAECELVLSWVLIAPLVFQFFAPWRETVSRRGAEH